MIYLNLTSTDSLALHPANTPYDFTIELPHAIEGRYRCALLELACEPFAEELYVFSDLCQSELVHDAMLPLLRIVSEPGEVNTPYYKETTRRHIQRINIYIRNSQFDIPTAEPTLDRVRITLALDRV